MNLKKIQSGKKFKIIIMKKIFLIFLIVVFIVIGLTGVLFYSYYFKKHEIKAPEINVIDQTFRSKEECEQKTGCDCYFQMCDYITEGGDPNDCANKTGWSCY
jgi:flagellar basal body-associated protein FliL